MEIDHALIVEPIGGLVPGRPEAGGWGNAGNAWHPPMTDALYPPHWSYQVAYLAGRDNDPPPVTVEVRQFPDEAWAQFFAKWSPNPELLRRGDPNLDMTPVQKFGNRIVMDRQHRSPDESGMLWFFWPSVKDFVVVYYRSKTIEEEVLRRYLEKYPSSLR
jgi:hypothetical protein